MCHILPHDESCEPKISKEAQIFYRQTAFLTIKQRKTSFLWIKYYIFLKMVFDQIFCQRHIDEKRDGSKILMP